MERAVVMVNKLIDAEMERLCCMQDFIKQEAAAEDRVQGEESCSGRHPGKIYIKSEVPDSELEAVTVEDMPIDWHQEPQASSSPGSHAVTFKKEVEDDSAEARSGRAEAEDKLMEGSSGACYTRAVHQGPAGASQGSADSLPSDVSGSGSGVEAASPNRLMSRPLLCDHCDYSTGRIRRTRRRNSSLMELHLRVGHKLGCYYECELCDYSTMYMRTLKRHLAGKHVIGHLFECEFCDYSSAVKKCVERHRASNHGEGLLFKCELCDYVSARTDRVREHQASKHGEGQLFGCEFCDYSSARTSRVKEHLASKHGKGQLFKCELCEYYSAQKSNVKLHQTKKHGCNNSYPF